MERVDTTMVGTWVANLEDSEALLVLKPDGTCSMGVGTVKYNAKWTFSDNTLNLEQNGSVIQGVYDGECITLPVGAFELRFYRREQADGAVDATPEADQAQSAGAD